MLHTIDLPLARLPLPLEGLRLAHLSDLHIRSTNHRLYRRLAPKLRAVRIDLLLLSGDYMHRPGHEHATRKTLDTLLHGLQPRLGAFGVFGNHDTPELPRYLQGLGVHWLDQHSVWLADGGIELLGLHEFKEQQRDAVALALQRADPPQKPRHDEHVRLMLAHRPETITTAADMGVDVLFAGHTHGGQCRLPFRRALVNSTDLPLRLTSGLLRHQHTLAAVSRGLGHTGLPPRILCPPHVPLYSLRRGELPGDFTNHIRNVRPW